MMCLFQTKTPCFVLKLDSLLTSWSRKSCNFCAMAGDSTCLAAKSAATSLMFCPSRWVQWTKGEGAGRWDDKRSYICPTIFNDTWYIYMLRVFNMSLHHSNTGISMWAQQPRALELYCQHTDTKVRDSTSRYSIEFYMVAEHWTTDTTGTTRKTNKHNSRNREEAWSWTTGDFQQKATWPSQHLQQQQQQHKT